MIKVYYATHNTPSYGEGCVVLFDDDIEQERGLAESGYFQQIITPERNDGPVESADRTR